MKRQGLKDGTRSPMIAFEIPETGMRMIPKREKNAQGKWELTPGAREMLRSFARDMRKK